MVGGKQSINSLQILNLKHRSISNDNNNNKKSIHSIDSSDTGGGNASNYASVNQNMLKQSQDPNVNKRLAQRDYLKYSAFCQLGNNNGGESVDDNKSFMT